MNRTPLLRELALTVPLLTEAWDRSVREDDESSPQAAFLALAVIRAITDGRAAEVRPFFAALERKHSEATGEPDRFALHECLTETLVQEADAEGLPRDAVRRLLGPLSQAAWDDAVDYPGPPGVGA